MKASEVLERYAAGERNFQRLNLRGQSFKNQNLSGADFSEADIRSTNFAGANLREANFTGAKCGLQKRWATVLTLLSWFLAGISGVLSMLIGFMIPLAFDSSKPQPQITVWILLITLVSFLILIICEGIVSGLAIVLIVIAISAVMAVGLSATEAALAELVRDSIGVSTVPVAVAIVAIVSIAVALSVTRSAAFVVLIVAILISITAQAAIVLIVVASAGAVSLVAIGIYISWRVMKGDPRDIWIRSFAIAFSSLGGTSFCGADLTDANFAGAKLKSTNFRKANLTRVRWYGAKMLDRVRPGDTYLKSTQVRQWLIGKGENKNFDGQKLQGVNFQGANLTEASFIDTNLNEANFQDADLSRAKLVQTQLDGTDFTRATLTGAFIEDWGITSSTNLKGVKCEYVFMRLPPEKRPKWLPLPVEESLDPNPRRKPDNWDEVFEGDDFADFIKPIFDTLDLYHNQEVDPRAIAISWKKLAEDNPDANLRFASMEVKGEDNLLLRLKTAPNADLSKLSAEYFETYNQIKALAEQDVQKLIAEKDDRIQALENMVNTALKRPGFYAENYTHQGDNQMNGEKRDIKTDTYYEQSGKIGIGHVSGGKFNNTKISGEINETQQQNLADAAAEIQNLLEQLSQTYPTNTSKEKNIVVAEVVDQIENNSTLKAKVINALQAGGKEALKEAIDHPLVNILMATIEGWQNS